MKNKITILLLSILLVGCQNNTTKTKENIGQNDKSAQQSIKKENEDENLLTRSSYLSIPSNIKSPSDGPYLKDELKNLDYNKEFLFENLNLRLPARAKIKKDESIYKIILPKSKEYDIDISFKDIENNKILQEDDLLKACDLLIKSLDEELVSKPLINPLSNIDSAYFLTKKGDISFTHILIKAPNKKIHFVIREDLGLSRVSNDLMTDFLAGIYRTSDDPLEISKNFTDYSKEIPIYATNKIDLEDLSINIPDGFSLSQDNKGIKAYISKKDGTIVSEIIIKAQEKEDHEIEDVFNKNSGSLIYPANIINQGILEKSSVRNHPYLKSKAKLYMPAYTLKGNKIVIEGESTYVSIFVLGPLVDKNQTDKMTESIINSIS